MSLNSVAQQYQESPEPGTLDHLTELCTPMVKRYTRSLGRSLQREDLQDLEGELWLEFMQLVRNRLPGFKGNFKKFLSTRLYYAVLKFHRRKVLWTMDYDLTSCDDPPYDEFEEVVESCLKTVAERRVFHDMMNLVDPEETADALGLSPRRIYQIRDELHGRIKEALYA